MEFKDKVAIVTGASSGVGYAISNSLASNGYNLVLAARRLKNLEDSAVKFKSQYGVRVLPVKTDLTLREDIVKLFKKTEEEFGRLDALVNVAGDFLGISFVGSDTEKFMRVYDQTRTLMLDAVIYASKLAVPLLKETKGVIVNISSDAGLERKVYPNQLPYLIVKAGVNHATRGMDLELKGIGARAFAIAPGNIDTPLLREAVEGNKEWKKLIEEEVGSLDKFYKKILKPQDIAEKVVDILKKPDSYTGAVIEMPSFEF